MSEKDGVRTKTVRTWYGRKKVIEVPVAAYDDLESSGPEPRPAMLLAPAYNGLAAGLSICEHYNLVITHDKTSSVMRKQTSAGMV